MFAVCVFWFVWVGWCLLGGFLCGYLLVVFSGCLLWLCRMLVNSVVCGNDLLPVVCVFDVCVLLVWVG